MAVTNSLRVQDKLNILAGTVGLREAEVLRVLNARQTSADTCVDGWNRYAGTTGKSRQACANLKAGTSGLRVQDAVNKI